MGSGKLILSLDFELYWGLHDVFSIEQYEGNLTGTWEAIPAMLELFQDYEIHATWGIVGMLLASGREELYTLFPEHLPSYETPHYSAYEHCQEAKLDEQHGCYFAPDLVEAIAETPHQEVATHTFSHYYCLEEGQTEDNFRQDLLASKALHARKLQGCAPLTTILFPRNQTNEKYLNVCRELGLTSYRGNEESSIYEPSSFSDYRSVRSRVLRLIDAYVNITGSHTYPLPQYRHNELINLPSSRFLRPYVSNLKLLEGMRLKRITKAMTKAAKEGEVYHLWWHPHNFGRHLEENLAFLEKILQHYRKLQQLYGMESMSMQEAASEIEARVEQVREAY
ncbi:polysaccharide deacetylase family protein [Pontibacillus halophilus]|nr:polysaccharide deacetylase family protein [Pontibacillus halophilus]